MQRIIFYELAMTPPVPMSAVQAGDRFVIDDQTHNALHLRGVTIVSERPTNWPGTLVGEAPPVPPNDGIYHLIQGRVKPMDGVSVALTRVVRNTTTGAVNVFYSADGSEEFESWEAMGASVADMDQTTDFAKKLLKLMAFKSSPNGENMEAMIGAQVSVNRHASQPVVFTPPE